jgi:Domain of unknown function (DUF3597)
MSLFSSILDKLGIKKAEVAAKPAAPVSTASAAPTSSVTTIGTTYSAVPKAPAPAAPTAIPVVDVVSKLNGLAERNPLKLNWKESIVDLLVLLGLGHSEKDLEELATELNCPASALSSSFKRNMWLHKTVLQKIAENGGNIPRELLNK